MSAWDGLNRRKFPRIGYPCMVTVRLDENKKEAFLAHTENVGLGGVCLVLKKEIKMFAPVDIELDLMDMGEHIKCPGKVVWSVRRKSGEKDKPLFYDIGIEFVNLNEAYRQRIEKSVQHLARQGKLEPRV